MVLQKDKLDKWSNIFCCGLAVPFRENIETAMIPIAGQQQRIYSQCSCRNTLSPGSCVFYREDISHHIGKCLLCMVACLRYHDTASIYPVKVLHNINMQLQPVESSQLPQYGLEVIHLTIQLMFYHHEYNIKKGSY